RGSFMSRYYRTPLGEDPPPPAAETAPAHGKAKPHPASKRAPAFEDRGHGPSPLPLTHAPATRPSSAILHDGDLSALHEHHHSWLLLGGVAVGAGALVWLLTRSSRPRGI